VGAELVLVVTDISNLRPSFFFLVEASKAEREKLNKRFARIVKESIEESGDPQIRAAIANKIKARILK